MGKPAARITDTTAHGGTIVSGYPTVIIGGMPASRITDMHVCPAFNGPVPHVGGPLILGSFTVLTGMMPQSRIGDLLICVGPPDTVVTGCWTVLIGDAGSGAGGFAGFMAAVAGVMRALAGQNYPRAELQPDGTIATVYAPNVLVRGTPEQQVATMRQLDAVRAGPGGPEFFASLANRPSPVTLRVIGDPAGGAQLYPGQQSYQNCAVQSAQQIIHQATGNNYDESTMENVANNPASSGYTRTGGTPAGGEEQILENGGVPAHMEPGNTANVDRALANNQGVISGHDAGRLWNDPSYNGSGHDVNTTGAVQDDSGQTLAYTINDTGAGRQGRVVPADQYANSMDGGPIAVTDNPIR
jgi:uncharacterized Zn-binding protein involved in type VI secretion